MISFLTQNRAVIAGVVCYVVTAAVNSLPEPSETFELYPWFYHTVKQLANAVPCSYKPKAELPN